jgi:hypothetical protein
MVALRCAAGEVEGSGDGRGIGFAEEGECLAGVEFVEAEAVGQDADVSNWQGIALIEAIDCAEGLFEYEAGAFSGREYFIGLG